MRSLFFKIFIIFWIAQSLIFVISTILIVKRSSPRPDLSQEYVFNDVRQNALGAVAAFESGGCAALLRQPLAARASVALRGEDGAELCASSRAPVIPLVLDPAVDFAGKLVGSQYIWQIAVAAPSGRRYTYSLELPRIAKSHSWYEDLFHFAFPQLLVAIAVGGVTTFVLVLIFTRPVIHLRKAARELAQGKLATRVKQGPIEEGIFRGDEFDALIRDFNHMAERLQSLVDAQKLLLRDVSHELRSPLSRLNVALELSREAADEAMSTHLNRIEREAERLNHLIGQLLTLSSMEAAQNPRRLEAVSLNQLVEELLPDARYEAQQNETALSVSAACECVIQGERELLYHAFENIVRNAIRFTDKGTNVDISLYEAAEGAQKAAILEVSDRGPGIPEDEAELIFRPFYRVDHARSAQTGGAGVGLAIADRAIKLHNGQIRATNRSGGGTTVQVRFPLP